MKKTIFATLLLISLSRTYAQDITPVSIPQRPPIGTGISTAQLIMYRAARAGIPSVPSCVVPVPLDFCANDPVSGCLYVLHTLNSIKFLRGVTRYCESAIDVLYNKSAPLSLTPYTAANGNMGVMLHLRF